MTMVEPAALTLQAVMRDAWQYQMPDSEIHVRNVGGIITLTVVHDWCQQEVTLDCRERDAKSIVAALDRELNKIWQQQKENA